MVPAMVNKKRPSRRKRNNLIAARNTNGLSLGVLANLDVVAEIFNGVVDQRCWVHSWKGTVALRDLTPGQGPIQVGLAHSDYTAAEIEEWIEASGAWGTDDKISQEQSRRKVRLIGVFNGENDSESLQDGRPIKITCKWYIEEGQSLQVWAYNQSGAAFSSTVPVIVMNGTTFMTPA